MGAGVNFGAEFGAENGPPARAEFGAEKKGRGITPPFSAHSDAQDSGPTKNLVVNFAAAPPIGSLVWIGRQRYELTETKPHERRDGVMTTLLGWTSECARCASPFVVFTPIKSSSLNRRCQRCKRPGSRA